MILTTTLTTLGLIAASTASAIPQAKRDSQQKQPIEWRSCPDVEAEVSEAIGIPVPQPFECAALPVPLDYTEPDLGLLNLALIRVPATKEPVLGTVLYNPGGPGGTGVENLAFQAPELHAFLGGQYHLVSWDPRGTGRTIPFDCKVSELAGLERRDMEEGLISTNLTERYLNFGYDSMVLYAETCYATNNATGDFIGTAFTARDMVEIVDGLDEDGLLRYWGLSYGTQLGDTFAAMFPERVGRMLLDANMNPHEYQVGSYGDYLHDAEKTLFAFLDECLKNADRCALAEHTNATSRSDLLDVINAGLGLFTPNATVDPETWNTLLSLKLAIYSDLYWPRRWPLLADTITSYLNGSAFEEAPPSNESVPQPYNLGPDAINGIRCGDSITRVSSAKEYLSQVEFQASTDTSFSDVGYDFTWACSAWKLKAKEQYTGDYTATTQFPILFVNGEYDPATPLVSAQNASAGFEGSVLLRHTGYGHGIMAHPSLCVARAVQAYFKDGTLPDAEVVCEPEVGAWDLTAVTFEDDDSEDLEKRSAASAEDASLLDAMMRLGRLQERMASL